ncbi:glycosyltransferase family 32 protein [Sphingobacterium spiritivorum]|uniref:glycosyltransferase family 32 protein n=1 Tax=Sphingobacterium spiritivorum TaxID=258 RepID=UPI003DA4773D
MAIPKIIYQTFKTDKIPLLTRFYIWRFMRKNKSFSYKFYNDAKISQFIEKNFDKRTFDAYNLLQIGAAKADFFRYAVLYIHGGIYLDLDSDITADLDKFLLEDDVAVITKENGRHLYAQWALIYDKGHPFLKRTIDLMVHNIETNAFPHDVHAMTGPTVYTKAILEILQEFPDTACRIVEDDYKGMMKFKYKFGKILIYRDRSNHWKKLQKRIPVVKPTD